MKKKILIFLSMLLVLFIITVIVVKVVTKVKDSVTYKEVSTEVEVQEDTNVSEEFVDIFEDASGYEVPVETVTISDNDLPYVKENILLSLRNSSHMQDFEVNFDISIDRVVKNNETGVTQYSGIIVGTDIAYVWEDGDGQSEADSILVSVCNKYGSDYSSIYWLCDIPEDALDIYETLYNNYGTGKYYGDKLSDSEYELTNVVTGEVTTLSKENIGYVWSKSMQF